MAPWEGSLRIWLPDVNYNAIKSIFIGEVDSLQYYF
jgi:hypothetical protein